MNDLTGGACVGHPDPELWFRGHHAWRQAVTVCGSCPVRQDCLAQALATEQLDWTWRLQEDHRARPNCEGVWGGLSAPQREALLDQSRRRRQRLAAA